MVNTVRRSGQNEEKTDRYCHFGGGLYVYALTGAGGENSYR